MTSDGGPVGYHRELIDLLRELRQRSGDPSFREIARRTPAALSHVSNVFNGRRIPSGDMAGAIAAALGGDTHEQMRARTYAENAAVDAVPAPKPVHRGAGRSAYLEQVRRIAPEVLYDRDAELAELATFCTAADQGPYVWWQAEAWAGKSALLSWFVLHPPAGVRVVSFFVTARLADQGDRVAFIDAVSSQLAEVLGRPSSDQVSGAMREAYLLDSLRAAAEASRRRGQRLILLVDGLDEDQGVVAGPDAYSIAALLPQRPPGGMRIVVAGRPHPAIPADVPDGHPLRDPAVVRVLDRSVHAQVVRVDAERGLKRLLHGTPDEQDLLGLVTAAGGGLSGPDLAALTNRPTWEIEERLHAVSGRTFARRVSPWRPDTAPEVYILAHEELQQTATGYLGGKRLEEYRRRLHRWADDYRQEGWPRSTPAYLLRGYYPMLRATGDLPRMVTCATDHTRHDRMLDITAGDAVALAEIGTAQEFILDQDDPDPSVMARLAVHHDRIARRNANIPPELPAVWAALGQPVRAEALARSTAPNAQAEALAAVATSVATVDPDHAEAMALAIDSQYWQVRALAGVASATAGVDADRAARLAAQAETLARAIADPKLRLQALTAVVAVPGDRAAELAAHAEALTSGNSYEQTVALAALVEAVAAAGDREGALALADRAEALSRTITNPYEAGSTTSPYWQSLALAALAKAVAAAGEHDRAAKFADRAEVLSRSITSAYEQVYALATLAGLGEQDRAAELADRAEAIARSRISEPFEQELALTALADAAAAVGDRERVEVLIGSITTPRERARVLAALARAVAAAGEHDRAAELAGRAEAGARAFVSDPYQQTLALAALAKAVAAVGDRGRATELSGREEALAGSITSRAEHVSASVTVAGAMAAAGHYDRAAALARSIIDPDRRVDALAVLVAAVAAAGDRGGAAALVDEAETVACSITHPVVRELALAGIAKAVAVAGDHDRAEALARAITNSTRRAELLAVLAGARAAAGEHGRALALADQAEVLPLSDSTPDRQAALLAALAKAVVAAGDHGRALALVDRAEVLFRTIPDREYPMWGSRAAVVEAMAAIGDYDRAEALACSITNPEVMAQALAALANVLEPARARRFVARALRLGGWGIPLDALVQVQPSAVVAAADEFLALMGR